MGSCQGLIQHVSPEPCWYRGQRARQQGQLPFSIRHWVTNILIHIKLRVGYDSGGGLVLLGVFSSLI